MFKDREAALRLNTSIQKIMDAMRETRDLVRTDTAFSKKDRTLVGNWLALALGTDMLDVSLELYVAHHDLVPQGFLLPGEDPEKWAKKYKKVLRRQKKRRG